jgi:peptide/nickel transport system substrate-binding protein
LSDGGYWTRRLSLAVSRRRLIKSMAIGGGAIAGVSLLACGPKKSGTGAGAGGQAGSAAKGQPQPGGKVALNVNNDPFDWDLSYAGKTAPNGAGQALAYESLLKFKRGPEVKYGDLSIEPLLAQKWETPDAQTYTFHLRPNVNFANISPVNGRALASSDVKWSYEYWSRTGAVQDKKLPPAQFGWFFEGVDGVQAPDPQTVVVRFKKPFAPFASYVASNFNPIVPHEIFDQYGNLHDHIAGTGPYQLDTASSQKGSRWVWKKNQAYWDAGKPYIDEVDWLVLSDTSTAVAAFRTKQLDWIGNDILTFDQAAQLRKDAPDATQYANLAVTPLVIYMNVRVSPLNDMRVRQAIGFAVDRDEFIKVTAGGQGGWAMAGAFPDTFSQEELKQIQRFDLQQSKQLLSAAGYANGLDLEFIYPGKEYGDIYISEMQLLQSQLKKVGINLNLKSVEKDDFSNAKKSNKFVITIQPKGDLQGDVDAYAYASFYSTSKDNYTGAKDPKLDQLLDAQRQEADAANRRDLVRQAVRYIYDQGFGYAIHYGMTYEYAQARLKNYAPQFTVLQVPQVDSWIAK